ncbi:MAG: NAD-binding protein [Candidatus Micrarchaeota archaeon]|nr:NAD-binding protein [Candidatus Micrarchaeota archaeon]
MGLLERLLLYSSVAAIIIAVGSIVSYALSLYGGFNVSHLDLLNSIYYTISTLSTNSYGDIIPVSGTAKAFTIVLELSGISIFIGALTMVTTDVMEGRINKLTGGISDSDARKLRGHVVLFGIDNVNMYLASQLAAKKRRFVVLTNSRERFEELRELNYPIHVTNLTSKEAIKRYGIGFAESVVIDLQDKTLAMYVFLAARSLSGPKTRIRVIVRDKDMEGYFQDIAKGSNQQIINPDLAVANEILEKEL